MEHSFDKCSRLLLLLLLRAQSAAHLPGARISTVQSHGQRRWGEGNEREREEKGEDSHGTGAEPKTKPPKSCTLLPSNPAADMREKRQRGGKTNQMKIVRDLSGRPNLSAAPSVSLGLRQC